MGSHSSSGNPLRFFCCLVCLATTSTSSFSFSLLLLSSFRRAFFVSSRRSHLCSRRLPRQHELLATRAASPKLDLVCCSLKRRQSASFVSFYMRPFSFTLYNGIAYKSEGTNVNVSKGGCWLEN